MKNYRINYIDGHDLRYKSFESKAENEEAALSNLWASYADGDFDHQIVEVIELKDAVTENMRIGAAPFLTLNEVK